MKPRHIAESAVANLRYKAGVNNKKTHIEIGPVNEPSVQISPI